MKIKLIHSSSSENKLYLTFAVDSMTSNITLISHRHNRARQFALTVMSMHATCTQGFSRTKLHACKSIKTLLSNTRMLFIKEASFFLYLKANNIQHNKI